MEGWIVEAVKQVPALAVLAFVVRSFLASQRAFGRRLDRLSDLLSANTAVLARISDRLQVPEAEHSRGPCRADEPLHD